MPTQDVQSATAATKWADMSLYVIRHAKYNSPTYSSRSLGYLGLTMYESVVYADPALRSMNNQLNGLTTLPAPEPGASYQWRLVLNAAEAAMLKYLYPLDANISQALLMSIDSLSGALEKEYSSGLAKETVDRSIHFGESLAAALYQWSTTDGGNNGFQRHFDPSFGFPSGPSYWVPPIRGQTVSKYPLHPYWGNNRTFATTNSLLPVPAILPYTTDKTSDYYKVYKAVYEKNKLLTQEEKEIAAWWADDPTQTSSPPGHSYNLASLVVKKAHPTLVKAAETYARVGMATADAFICCWKAKFQYFNERPSTYVAANIDPTWIPYWPEPPFPAFPSGHSTQSAATATVLADLYGESFSFTDNTNDGLLLPPFDQPLKPRSFTSFWATAEEAAHSRFLGGIHTQQDNEVGLAEGKKIGQNINALGWKK